MSRTCITLLLLLSVPTVHAASCRAYEATTVGSQAGYNTARQAAEAWAQREGQVSLSLGKCLGDISTTITSPVFPSLSGILGKIEQEVCQAAQSEIDHYIPSTIDPWGDIPTPDIPDIPTSGSRSAPVSWPSDSVPPDVADGPVFSLN